MRRIKSLSKKIFHKLFVSLQRTGFNILPLHFYSQIPDINSLRKEDYWRKEMSLKGVYMETLDTQVNEVKKIIEKYPEVLSERNIHKEAITMNGEDGGFGTIEAEFLYCFIRNKMPQKIIQVGCGVSTAIILMAAADEGYSPKLICIEPYPTGFLRKLHSENKILLIKELAQKVDIEVFNSISSNDLFFIDSTHTVKPGSEVNRIILEILPTLAKNVWVHFHDIYFPYDYRRDLLSADMFFWNESTLLHAFLINNAQFKICICQSYIHYKIPEKLQLFFPHYIPQENSDGLRKNSKGRHFPCSIYLRTTDNTENSK